jgi:hypothetical protein
MVYYSNGGFNWNDVYYMPTKLREFYYRELTGAKDAEKKQFDESSRKSKSASMVRRK